MNKKSAALISIMAILGASLFIYLDINSDKQRIELDATKEEVLKEIKDSKEYTEKTIQLAEGNDQDIGYFHPEHAEHEGKEDPKKDAIKYFIAGLLSNNTDIFLSSFYVESISQDLFKSKNPDKDAVTKEIMDKISRNGTLKEILYKVNKGFLNTDSNTISLTIKYDDQKEATVNFDLLTLSDSHHEDEIGTYVITTSTWDIIKQIEASLQ